MPVGHYEYGLLVAMETLFAGVLWRPCLLVTMDTLLVTIYKQFARITGIAVASYYGNSL